MRLCAGERSDGGSLPDAGSVSSGYYSTRVSTRDHDVSHIDKGSSDEAVINHPINSFKI